MELFTEIKEFLVFRIIWFNLLTFHLIVFWLSFALLLSHFTCLLVSLRRVLFSFLLFLRSLIGSFVLAVVDHFFPLFVFIKLDSFISGWSKSVIFVWFWEIPKQENTMLDVIVGSFISACLVCTLFLVGVSFQESYWKKFFDHWNCSKWH